MIRQLKRIKESPGILISASEKILNLMTKFLNY